MSIDGLEKKISRLVLGTAPFSPNNIHYQSDMISEFLHLGGNALDTAQNYGEGESEKALGIWMNQHHNREDLVLISKGAHPDTKGKRVNPEAITHDLYGSLERLQTDYVDLYFLHRDDPSVPVGPIMEELNKHINVGLIKTIGASNWSYKRIQEANEYAAANGLKGFVCNSPNLSLAKPMEPMWPDCVFADEETCRWHTHNQLPLLSWSSQAGGFFSGRFSPENKEDGDMVRVYYNDLNWERYNRAKKLANQKDCDPIQIALSYVLNQKFPTAGIIGPRTVNELRSSYQALQIKLNKDEVCWLHLEEEINSMMD